MGWDGGEGGAGNRLVPAMWLSLLQHEVRTLWGAVYPRLLITHTTVSRHSYSGGATRQSGNSPVQDNQNKQINKAREAGMYKCSLIMFTYAFYYPEQLLGNALV